MKNTFEEEDKFEFEHKKDEDTEPEFSVDRVGFATLSNPHTLDFDEPATVLYYPDSVTDINIAQGITVIYPGSFDGLRNVTSIQVPPSVMDFGSRAFAGVSVKGIYLPEGGMYYGSYLFMDCKQLESVMFPASARSIGMGIFEGCDSLKKITVDFSNPRFFSQSNCVLQKKGDEVELIAGCKASEIPIGVTRIGTLAFSRIHGLQFLKLPDTLKEIGELAFSGCSSLSAICFTGEGLSIQGRAFSGCNSLTNVALSDGVVSLGDYCFACCNSVKYAYIPHSVKSMGEEVFSECMGLETVFCEAASKPEGWCENWLGTEAEVKWGVNKPPKKLRTIRRIELPF